MIVTTGQLFKHAYGKYAVGAYNINNAEQAMGLFKGCIASQAPFIIQISKGARKYTDKRMLEAIIRSAAEIFPEAIFAVHLDHGDEQTCYECIDSGFFSSVMIDASHEPFDQNVAITKRVVDKAHAKGISVEAELGMLGGVEEDIKVDEGHAMLTNPEEAKDFVAKTGCDSLACAIGTSHGAFKFKGRQSLHFDVLEKIKALLPGFPLVMHGSSSVPQDEVARINAAGGKIAGSMGVDVNEYLPAAKRGVTKVNIDTDGRLVWTRVHREYFRDNPGDFDFRPAGKIFIEEYAKFIASRNVLLGSANQLADLRKSLGEMNVAGLSRRHWVLFLLLPLCTLHAEILEDAPGRYAVDIARPIKRELKQNETDAGTVVICDLFHADGDILEWITYSDYPAGTMSERDPVRIYDRWPKGDAATRHGKLRNCINHRLGETVGREFVIDVEQEKKVVRARVYIVGDRTYRISYTGPAGSEDSPAARHFLNSFSLKP